jgi:citrate synthase
VNQHIIGMHLKRRAQMPKSPYLTAREAAAELGIKLPTLYSYVSRGLVRSEIQGNNPRTRRYHAEDVQRLKARQEQQRDPSSAVAGALHWGAPVLESALTRISDGKLYYRGYDAIALTSQRSVEEVAGLLWDGNGRASLSAWEKPISPSARAAMETVLAQVRRSPLLESFQMALLMSAPEDPSAHNLRPGAVRQTGVRILRLLTSVAAGQVETGGIVQTLTRSWAPDPPAKAAPLLNAALILMADHELNVSSFTVRCVASARATPYEAVIAGLAALQGANHGGVVNRVEALLDEIQKPANVRLILSRRLKHGEEIPGFGHRLYLEGDPRARLLLELMAEADPRAPAISLARAAAREARELIDEEPNSDFALAVLTRLLDLPEGYGLGIFALGRTIGWLAHALEQYQSNAIIRPRARYVGRMPQ